MPAWPDCGATTIFEFEPCDRNALRARVPEVDFVIVLDGGKGIVEVVEECFPALVFGRASESNGVIFKRFPIDEQQVAGLVLDAALEAVADVSRHG